MRFLDLAVQEPNSRIAPDALRATIVLGPTTPEASAAIELLRRDWAASPRIASLCGIIATSTNTTSELLLREVLAKNPDRTAQGHACLALAGLLCGQARVPRLVAQDPQAAKTLERRLGKEGFDKLMRQDPGALMKEAEALYERVAEQYAEVKRFPEVPYGMRLKPEFEKNPPRIGKQAEDWLAAYRELRPGKPAPEIRGRDMDGKTLKLSDFRGKVVVLSFWAPWCAPCVAEIPHERELADRLKGIPFALLGVNCDRTEADARAILAREKMTWPNWYDGEFGKAQIAESYHIQALPTIYVIDSSGTIRYKDLRWAGLAQAVDELLEKG
jgi:thiol-disulfide isomerase/thioredoxin